MNLKERNNKQITYEIFYTVFYLLNKYNITIGNITRKYYDSHRVTRIKKNYDLFLLNKDNKESSEIENIECKHKMIYLSSKKYRE